uniref:peptidylprolyl isomerase n=1 Tax=Denticeps clupeoides TaxID=299321 RepID=A0AAY4EDU4_9TELE
MFGSGAWGQTPFRRLAAQMQDVLGDGGVLKEVVREGEGPTVPMDASVSVHLSAFLEYSEQPFQTTRHLKEPRMMKLGRDVSLPGLELGLLTMKKGEFSRFLLLPSYAYGDLGCPPTIPPRATVLFEVHILDFLDSAQVDEFFALTPEEQNAVPLAAVLSVVNAERTFGNHCFRQGRYEDAKDRYKQAITLLQNRDAKDEEERQMVRAVRLPVLLNLSLTYLRLERPTKSLQIGQKALKVDPSSTKALFRCGQPLLPCPRLLFDHLAQFCF